MNKHDAIKELLMLANTTQEAKDILDKHTNFKSTGEKIAYLTGMFNIEIAGKYTETSVSEEEQKRDELTSILAVIIDMKWS